jgi:Sec7 domain/Guanine nucleotide exchange factor in Golgi transport N-terminal
MRRVKSDNEDTRCQNNLDFASAKNRMPLNRNENDEAKTTTLDSARAVVRSILDQIAIHDCPPINERVDPSYSKYKRVTNRSTGPRQQHLTSSMVFSVSSSNGSATTSESSTVIEENSEAAAQWNAQYQRRRKQVEMKMGHVALATLCQQTLDYTATSPGEGNQENQPPLKSRLKPSLKIDTAVLNVTKYVEDDRNPNSVSEQSVLSPLVGLSLESNRPSFGDPPALRFTAEAMIDNINNLPTPVTIRGYDDLRLLNCDDASLCLGHRSHRDPPIMESRDPSPTFQRLPVHPIFLDVPNVGSLSSEDNAIDQPPEYPDISNAEEIRESESLYDTFQGTVHNQRLMEIYCGPRFQMFGSEYARFLSETPLAPKHRKNILYKLSKPSRQVNELGLSWKMQREELQEMSPDKIDNDILTGAITDLAITRGSSLPPKGFHRLSHALFGENFGSREIHINVKKEPDWDRAAQRPCVTALTVIFPDRKEVVPPGFCVVSFCDGANTSRNSKWNALNPADLNLGQSKERVYLCYRRSREGNPLTGLIPLVPNNLDPIPEGYTVLERSPRNHVADLNGGGSYSIFLAYRQRLASLEPLRPLPMILSIYREAINNTTLPMSDTPFERGQAFSAIFQQAKLRAYYCTGGTTVQSNVGKYHIMDRSTHSLLSPTSISNRLALIQASRQKNNNLDSASHDHKSIYLSENHLIQNATIVSHSTYELDDDESLGDSSSKVEKLSVGSMPHGSNRSEERKVPFLSLFSNNDSTFQYCLNATSAIPVIETPLLPQIDDDISLECRMAIITPILTACYTQHGRAAMIAVQGLDSLLKDTSFFRADIVSVPYGEGSEGRLTILDLAMQSVCDLATSTAREAFFMHCVEFVKEAVTFSQAHLNGRTIGCVFRFYLFVFYFGASVPTSSTAPNTVWPSFASSGSSSRSSVAQADVPFLLEGNLDYFPGGAPQAAAIALKEFISLLMNRLVAISYSESQTSTRERKSFQRDCSSYSLVDGIVDSLVDDAVRRVDVANATQLALHQIHRSGGSELFWYDMMTSCGGALFGGIQNLGNEGKSVFIILFSMLANIVKICSGRMRVIPSSGTLIPRDVASKLLSLELLKHYMISFRELMLKTSKLSAIIGQKEGRKTLNYCIRRLVVPCLLSNTIQGLQDSRVFRRLIHIISEMWKSPVFRQYLKLELAVLMEQFVLNLLCLGPQLLSPEQMNLLDQANSESIQPLGPMLQILSEPLYNQQVDLLFEINRWFQGDAKSLLEFFLNFNTDISDPNQTPSQWMPGGQRKLCERLCKAVCLIAEQSGNVIANQIKDSRATNQGPSTPSSSSSKDDQEFNKDFERDNDKEKKEGSEKSMANARQGARQLQEAAIAAASQIARCIALAAAKSVGHNEAAVVGKKYPEKDEIWFHGDAHTLNSSASHSRASSTGDNSILAYWRTAIASDRKKGFESRQRSHHSHSHSSASEDVSTLEDASACDLSSNATGSTASETLKSAFRIVESKSLKKGIEFLIQKHFLSPSPRDVATFLRIHHSRLNSQCLGDYFGEVGVDDSEIEYLNLVRFNYVRAISFVGMTVEQG